MEHGHRALELGEAEVGIERRQLGALQQRLVDDGAAGERRHVEAGQAQGIGPLLHGPAGQEQRALPRIIVGDPVGTAYQHLPDDRLALSRAGAEGRRVHRHIAPADERQTVLLE
ncbi:MAG: hypothetical protein H6Q77_2092, partial [Gemmatimonadetes bacterium]|nr:hypothetical protein [Gemmatimonadota bacterium]